jgi:membrane-bound lytic murein transglycosylase B
MRRRTAVCATLALLGVAPSGATGHQPAAPGQEAAAPGGYGRRANVMAAAQRFAHDHDLDPAWVEATLAQARYVPAVAQLIMPAPRMAARNWAAYRARFVEARRIDAGQRWWRDNETWLRLAHERFGVPPEVIVGIVGVETFYGRITGNFRVLDALATLAFDFPSGRSDRSAFFRSELGYYLGLVHRLGWNPAAVKGSYAGAMGLPQFMPSSMTYYAVDFDEDGRIDLHANAADVIGSVARFLAEHAWERDLPTHYAVEPPAATVDKAMLLAPDIVPSFSPAQMRERGARLDEAAVHHDGLLALVELSNADDPPSYVAGTQNFYVLTRYNASSYYALAVIELGRAIAAANGTPPQ